jgi:hypothetical protein
MNIGNVGAPSLFWFPKEGLVIADAAMAVIDEDEIEPTIKITDITINDKRRSYYTMASVLIVC